eukprot:436715-Rhodomonas_salina.3
MSASDSPTIFSLDSSLSRTAAHKYKVWIRTKNAVQIQFQKTVQMVQLKHFVTDVTDCALSVSTLRRIDLRRFATMPISTSLLCALGVMLASQVQPSMSFTVQTSYSAGLTATKSPSVQ